jgi:hypothetical protein
MKAALAALLVAAVVFVGVLAGIGTGRRELVPDSLQLEADSPVAAAPQAPNRDPNPKNNKRDRQRRGVNEVPREIERVALADLDVPGDGRNPQAGGGDDPPQRPNPPPDGSSTPPPSPAKGVAVPSLVSLDIDDARAELERRGLVLGDISQRDSCKDEDEVLRQSIAAGTEVSRGTRVSVTTSTGDEPDEDNSGSGSSNSGPGSDNSGHGSGGC